MLTPWPQEYEQQSIRRTLCAGCTKELTPEETYACAECVDEWLIYRDPNGDITNEDSTSKM